MKNLLITLLLSLFFFSCDTTMLVDVELSGELSNQGYSVSDYDFVLAQSGNSEVLYFEFTANEELPQNSSAKFYGKDGKILATQILGALGDLNLEDNEQRSFVYSIPIVGFKSSSLIEEVRIE